MRHLFHSKGVLSTFLLVLNKEAFKKD
jgi:hypothetical protein